MNKIAAAIILAVLVGASPSGAEELCIGPACFGDHHRDRDDESREERRERQELREERREQREREELREERRERERERLWR